MLRAGAIALTLLAGLFVAPVQASMGSCCPTDVCASVPACAPRSTPCRTAPACSAVGSARQTTTTERETVPRNSAVAISLTSPLGIASPSYEFHYPQIARRAHPRLFLRVRALLI